MRGGGDAIAWFISTWRSKCSRGMPILAVIATTVESFTTPKPPSCSACIEKMASKASTIAAGYLEGFLGGWARG